MKALELANPYRQKVVQQLPGAGRKGQWGVTADRYVVSLGGDENILKLDSGNDSTTL